MPNDDRNFPNFVEKFLANSNSTCFTEFSKLRCIYFDVLDPNYNK